MSDSNHRLRSRQFRRGSMVAVRELHEILATLDPDGKLEGIPFMPEMVPYCGRVFRVERRVENVYLDRHYYVGRLGGTVLLEGARCDGTSHGGCQIGCKLLWREAWLRPAEAEERDKPEPAGTGRPGQMPPAALNLPTERDGRFSCQATELIGAVTHLPWWDFIPQVLGLLRGELTPLRFLQMLAWVAYDRLRWSAGRPPFGTLIGNQEKTDLEPLGLQPGELVEVKSRDEIRATLDAQGRHRGLAFATDMLRHCGRRYRVARRVGRMILEWNGQSRDLKDTVALEGVICRGIGQRCCPRGCFHLWREAWLKRVSLTDSDEGGMMNDE